MDKTQAEDLGESQRQDAGSAPVPGLDDLAAREVAPLPGTAREWESVWQSLDDLDEITIVARAQDGELEAFEWLLTKYQGGLFRLSLRMLGDRSEAEDVVQETFISAWRALPNLSEPQAFLPWLYRTTTNKCLDILRARKRRGVPDPRDSGQWNEASGAGQLDNGGPSGTRVNSGGSHDPAKEYENQAQMRALAELLQTVPPGPRACWLLKEVHEFSYREIAAIVQLSESTVRGRIARARRFLAEGMEPWR